MKKILSITAFLMLLVVTSCKKEDKIEEGLVYEYDISLYSQADVNEFALHKYIGVEGNLIISGTDIIYLDSLYSLKFVNGAVQIGSTSINNTVGLHNISSIAANEVSRSSANLYIYENAKLTTVNFPLVNKFRGSFTIIDNDLLNTIYLPKIAFTEDLIKLENNPELKNLNFNALNFIGGTLWIKNTGLENLNGFGSVINMQDSTPGANMSFDAGIHISNNNNLTSLDGLSALLKIGGECLISHNPKLIEINSLATVSSVRHGIDIQFNDLLVDLEGLRNVTSVDAGIVITHNGSLSNLCGLSSCYDDAASFTADWNAYDPTYQDMEDGNCSQ